MVNIDSGPTVSAWASSAPAPLCASSQLRPAVAQRRQRTDGVPAPALRPRSAPSPVTVKRRSRSGQHLVALDGVLDDHQLRARVADDELALLGRVRGVDRNGDAARQQDADVAEGPLEAGLGHQADPIAGDHAGRHQPRRDLAGRGVGLGVADGLPGFAREVAKGGGGRHLGHPPLPHLHRRPGLVLAKVGGRKIGRHRSGGDAHCTL